MLNVSLGTWDHDRVMANLPPVAAIIPVHRLVQLRSNVGRAAIMAKYMRLDLSVGFTAGALIGTILGGTCVLQLEPGWIQMGVGLFILWSILAPPPPVLLRSGLITGAFTSFLTMFLAVPGRSWPLTSKPKSLSAPLCRTPRDADDSATSA